MKGRPVMILGMFGANRGRAIAWAGSMGGGSEARRTRARAGRVRRVAGPPGRRGCARRGWACRRRCRAPPRCLPHSIKVIEAAGLVERTPDPDDRRGALVRHTPAGRALLAYAL